LVLLHREPVGDDRAHVETCLQEVAHLVPGLEHLPAVDALDVEALEDDFVPVDGDVPAGDAEQRHLASVDDRVEDLAEGTRSSRHLHGDVEALCHTEVGHDVFQVRTRLRDVDGAAGSHGSCHGETLGIDVGYHYVPGADEARHSSCHQPDRTRTCDKHVLAYQVVGQRCVDGIAQRVEYGSDVVRYRVRQAEGVDGRQRQVVRERPLTLHPDTQGVAAQVPAACAAAGAVTGGRVALA